MSKTKEMLNGNYNSVMHSDISKMSAIEVMVMQSIKENNPDKIKLLLELEYNLGKINCPVVDLAKAKKKPKK